MRKRLVEEGGEEIVAVEAVEVGAVAPPAPAEAGKGSTNA